MGLMETPAVGGQLVLTPHPVTLEGQRHIPMDLRPGERLCSFLHRHVIDIDQGDWVVSIGGQVVPRAMWAHVTPKDGQVIELRGAVGKTALYIVAMVALTYFTFGIGSAAGWGAGAAAGAFGGGAAGALFASAIFVAGSMLINKVLGPKAPSISKSDADSVYSIGAGRNQLRPYEPLPLPFGPVKAAPDLASKPYTWYEGNDQYVGMVLTPGINVQSVGELYNGDALLSSYEGVTVWYSGMPGMPEQTIPLYSNVDTTDGGELPDTTAWVQRTTGTDTVRIQINLEYILGGQGTSGKNYQVSETVQVQYSPTGLNQWATLTTRTFSSSKIETQQRATLAADVPRGQYDVRVRILGQGNYSGKNTQRNDFQWSTLSSVQADDATYAGIARIGIRIKATGQLNGAPDEIRCVIHHKPCQLWDGSAWATQETDNPGANILAYARGYYDENGRLIGGMGLPDSWIDIESLKGFMLHCAANSYAYRFFIKSARNHEEMLDALALAGMGQVSWAGGRLSVVWAADQQPMSGVVNMATMKRSSFQVDYTLANPADGIEYSYYDAETWETKTLRVVSPAAGYETALNPARVTGEGITSEAHAAVMARWHLAQSLYQYKDISYSADLEHLSYRRMSVLALQHDLTQWGFGGRVVSASTSGGVTTLHLDDAVPPPASGNAYIGLRIPGEAGYRVLRVQSFSGEPTNTIALAEEWPADAALPGSGAANPAHDTIWVYDFKQTPGYRVRVVSIEPEGDMKGAAVAVVPEGPEFWEYVLRGNYIPPANQSLLQTRPIASNLVISEEQTVQGDTVFTELVATFDITGPASRTVVLSDLDRNGELEQVAETTTRTARWRIPGAGTYPITVRPYSPDGFAGVAVSAIYTTQGADAPPALVDTFTIEELSGGVRRYSWGYNDDTIQSADFAGVEIRYTAGSVTAPAWETMTPLGDTGYHAAAFEAVLPASGTWTFACRSRNTSGTLSTDARIVTQTLGANLGQQLGEVGEGVNAANQRISQEIVDRFNAIVAEADARAAADLQEAQERTAAIQASADVLQAQINDVFDADEWVSTKTYPLSDVVKSGGKLYRSKQANNLNHAVTDEAWWELIGNYSGLADAVGGISQQTQINANNITTVDGKTTANAQAISGLNTRMGTAEGNITANGNALSGLQTTVTQQGTTLSSQGQSIVSLQNALPGKADASALSALENRVTNAEGVNTSQSASITSLNGRIGSNPNLLPNGGFERGTIGWNNVGNLAANSNIWGRVLSGAPATTADRIYTDFIDVANNAPYTLSADTMLFASSSSAASNLDVLIYDANGNGITTVSGAARNANFDYDATDASRQNSKVTFTTPSNAAKVRIGLYWNANGATITSIGFRQVKFERGSVATRYSAESALTADATALSSLTTTVTQQGNTITSQGTAITSLQNAVGNKADASALSTLNTKVDNNYTAQANAITQVQARTNIRNNLLPNGGFEKGRWTQGEASAFAVGDGGWGRNMYHSNPGSINGGGHAVNSDSFDVFAGETYTVGADMLLIASGGSVRTDIEYLNSSNQVVGSGTLPSKQATFNFSDDPARRDNFSFSSTAPAGAVAARVRFVWEGVTGCQALAVRKVKVESGSGPATAYSSEAMLALTATAQAASFTLALNVNGYVSGVTSLNNGTTSTFDILSDTVRFLAPNGGARTEFSNGNWRVYDGNGVLRTAMGINI